MSKIDIGLILGKSFTVIKKQPFILIPFLILAFLSAVGNSRREWAGFQPTKNFNKIFKLK
ncbi:hypothetical protein BEH94_01845 [Candidatus Altiarchaeales archaeon WOR_SM1_SCG]|nr:hypothetical protein BEH94_01845 [Candidatus Altiarchaeales archaeon WOR_SM1_SCG]